MEKAKPGTYEYNRKYAEKYQAKFKNITFRLTPEENERFKSLVKESGMGMGEYIKSKIFD